MDNPHTTWKAWKTRLIAPVTIAFALALTVPTVSFADTASGCDFSPANNGVAGCLGPLTGSTFAGGDGNLAASPTAYGSTDWSNVSGLNPGFDLPSGKGDNSFGQGTKEDDPNVTVVTGSIPNNKSDLTRFYEASEFSSVNSHNFLYLAWERANSLGTANFDFEINQKSQPDLTTTGSKKLNRTAGDLLVTYDFTNGGGKPTIGLLRWLTSATVPAVTGFSTNVCFSSNTFPCWGDEATLSGTQAIGAVNNLDSVSDPLFPNSANYINPVPALQFGETAIDLTAANVFSAGTCTAFGSAFVRSRSSASFTAEIKDFIAPIPVEISNCGQIIIHKDTVPRGTDQVFSYTSNLPANANAGGVTCPTNTSGGIQSDGSFCLNDKGNSGTSNNTGNTVDTGNTLAAGTYNVAEDTAPTGFTFKSVACTVNGTVTNLTDRTNPQKVNITIAPNDVVVCTYTNQPNLGAIQITKTGKDKQCASVSNTTTPVKDSSGHQIGVCAGNNQAIANLEATFKVTTDSAGTNQVTGSPVTTSPTTGVVCIGGLAWSDTGTTTGTTYYVIETTPPTGYSANNTAAVSVTVTQNSTCGDGNEAKTTFTDTPLTNISASATSVVPGATNSTVVCTNPTGTPVASSGSTATDPATAQTSTAQPTGTYTCTITIDP